MEKSQKNHSNFNCFFFLWKHDGQLRIMKLVRIRPKLYCPIRGTHQSDAPPRRGVARRGAEMEQPGGRFCSGRGVRFQQAHCLNCPPRRFFFWVLTWDFREFPGIFRKFPVNFVLFRYISMFFGIFRDFSACA